MSGSEQEYGTMSSLLNKRKLVMFASSENPTWYIPVDVAAVVADINAGRLTTLNTVQRDALKAAGYEDLVNNMAYDYTLEWQRLYSSS